MYTPVFPVDDVSCAGRRRYSSEQNGKACILYFGGELNLNCLWRDILFYCSEWFNSVLNLKSPFDTYLCDVLHWQNATLDNLGSRDSTGQPNGRLGQHTYSFLMNGIHFAWSFVGIPTINCQLSIYIMQALWIATVLSVTSLMMTYAEMWRILLLSILHYVPETFEESWRYSNLQIESKSPCSFDNETYVQWTKW
jgi:hypothetical protein